jgi:hypothetical protein
MKADKEKESEAIEELLRGIKPSPGPRFYRRMARAPWSATSPRKPILRRLAATGLVFILAAVAVLVASPTLADQISRFFLFSASDQRVLQLTQAFEAYPGLTGDSRDFPLTFAETQGLAPFNLKQFSALPKGFAFAGGRYDPATETAMLRYSSEGKVILLTERKLGAVEEYSSVGGSARIEAVRVHAASGEYVRGGWRAFENTSAPGTPIPLIWDADLPFQAVRWAESGVAYEVFASLSENLQKADLLTLANGIK